MCKDLQLLNASLIKRGEKFQKIHSDFFMEIFHINCQKRLNSLSANPTKRSNALKQFVSNLPTNCLSVFDHFVRLALKGLTPKTF